MTSYTYHNLEESPQYAEKFNALVEKSFGYKSEFKLTIDFFPLINSRNFSNCYFILEEGEVIATCAYQKRKLVANTNFPVALMGAISVHEKFRGSGIGFNIVSYVLGKISDCAWIGLWSEKEQFFSKNLFFPFSRQYFLPKKYLTSDNRDYSFFSKKVGSLDDQEMEYWKKCYEKLQSQYMTLERTRENWEDINEISSSEIAFLTYKKQTMGYAIFNKGMDLSNIVHEFYSSPEHELDFLKCLNQQFALWLPCFQYKWDEKYIGSSLLIRRGNRDLWEAWYQEYERNEKSGRDLFISGLDSV